MLKLRWVAVAFFLAAFCSPWATGDDKKPNAGDEKPADSGAKMRGQLPQNWSKLGLSDEQKQRVYKLQSDFQNKMDSLQKQISDLKSQERKELEKVLTPGQRERLREILAGKAPSEK